MLAGSRAGLIKRPVSSGIALTSMRYSARRGLDSRRVEPTLVVRRELRVATRVFYRVGRVSRWLELLYGLCAEGQVDPAIDLVLEAVHDLLVMRDVARCNEILARADVERLSVHALIALLMETVRASEVLPARAGFYARVDAKLRRDEDPETDALLEGLR